MFRLLIISFVITTNLFQNSIVYFFNMTSKDIVQVETFEKWSFLRNFEIKEAGFVAKALYKYI